MSYHSQPHAMFLLFFAATAAAAVLLLLRIPSVWQSLMALDDVGDMHELGMALVAAREFQVRWKLYWH